MRAPAPPKPLFAELEEVEALVFGVELSFDRLTLELEELAEEFAEVFGVEELAELEGLLEVPVLAVGVSRRRSGSETV